jgi:cyclopropane-fatty-acyl-phospholipid synthase
MLFAKLLDKFLTDGAIEIIDHRGRRFHCGQKSIEPTVVARFYNAATQWRLLLKPQVAAGEGYMNGTIVLEKGTIRDFMALAFRQDQIVSEGRRGSLINDGKLHRLTRSLHQINVRSMARRNVKHHYDIGNDVYELFLGPTMQYSCAYWPPGITPQDPVQALKAYDRNEAEDLDEAQRRKIDHIIRKLQIHDGMRVLDIGCGWGGLAMEIARRFDCEVLGVSLSDEQVRYATEAAKKAGLGGRVRFEIVDYRDLTETFDRIVSVGMFEHVGVAYYRAFFDAVAGTLQDDGMFLLHTIGRIDQPGGTNPFIRKHIFPGGYIPALSEIMEASEKTLLRPTDIEVLRLHYAFTLREWYRRFQAARPVIQERMGDKFCRMWEFYLAGSEMAFVYGRFVNYQMQMTKSRHVLPITRDYLYSVQQLPPQEERAARGSA